MRFSKYHALGSDYVVMDAADLGNLTPATITRICARHLGIGAGGLLVRLPNPGTDRFQVRIIHADATEGEKSGNGLRCFARYLWDNGEVGPEPFVVETAGGEVRCQVFSEGRTVAVDLGRVCFDSHEIPVVGPPREVLQETLVVADRLLDHSAAYIGGPHCVVIRDVVSETEAQTLGPLIETHSRFPNLTNVQFVQVLDRQNLRIEIWERGAGYSRASGTGGCAAAAVAHRLGLCDDSVTVHMPGGKLEIHISPDFEVRKHGPVVKIAEGRLCDEALEDLCDGTLE